MVPPKCNIRTTKPTATVSPLVLASRAVWGSAASRQLLPLSLTRFRNDPQLLLAPILWRRTMIDGIDDQGRRMERQGTRMDTTFPFLIVFFFLVRPFTNGLDG